MLLLCVYDVHVRRQAHTFEAARVGVRGQLLGGEALPLLLCRFVDGEVEGHKGWTLQSELRSSEEYGLTCGNSEVQSPGKPAGKVRIPPWGTEGVGDVQ